MYVSTLVVTLKYSSKKHLKENTAQINHVFSGMREVHISSFAKRLRQLAPDMSRTALPSISRVKEPKPSLASKLKALQSFRRLEATDLVTGSHSRQPTSHETLL
jgi:hypothetical protein